MADHPMPVQRHGTYTGKLPFIKGKTADLQCYYDTGRCLAQFDDIATGYGQGWHDFAIEQFDLDPIVDDGELV